MNKLIILLIAIICYGCSLSHDKTSDADLMQVDTTRLHRDVLEFVRKYISTHDAEEYILFTDLDWNDDLQHIQCSEREKFYAIGTTSIRDFEYGEFTTSYVNDRYPICYCVVCDRKVYISSGMDGLFAVDIKQRRQDYKSKVSKVEKPEYWVLSVSKYGKAKLYSTKLRECVGVKTVYVDFNKYWDKERKNK